MKETPVIKHLVAFRFNEDLDPETVESVLAELATFPTLYPSMKRWALGRNISTRDDSMSHAFVVEFNSEDELLAYLHSDHHETFVREKWRGIVKRQAIVSFEV